MTKYQFKRLKKAQNFIRRYKKKQDILYKIFLTWRAQQKKTSLIMPSSSIGKNVLIVIIIIMAFLSCTTLGIVSIVKDVASEWENGIATEVTIQIQPTDNISIKKALEDASRIALSFEGVNRVKIINDENTMKLLEPWFGSDTNLEDFPVPRLITVLLSEGVRPDFEAMRKRLKAEIPGASLDDHDIWANHFKDTANSSIIFGILIFTLIITATILIVIFATQGVMAGNMHIIEVLHIIGARNQFIAHEFEKYFLILGLKGAMTGACLASIMFAGFAFWSAYGKEKLRYDEIDALFGTFTVGLNAYVGIFVLALFIAFLTSITSRITAIKHVGRLNVGILSSK